MALTKATLIDLNANELILDLDADTSITADTDDTIHFKIGGSDEITITGTALSPAASDGNALGTAALEWADLFLADGAVISLGDDQDVTLTHVADTGILLNSTRKIQFNDSTQFIHGSSATVLSLGATSEIDLTATAIDINGTCDVSGAFTTTTITASGIVKTDDTTEATSTTDGSLQTDGGLSVAKDAVFGDDVKLLSDAAVLGFGADGDVTLTHVADTGVLLNSTMAIQFNDASQYINAPSNAILDINATDEIELNATLVDINANVEISGTATTTGVHTFPAIPVFSAGINVSGGTIAGTVATATQNSITTATGLVSVGALDSGSITSGFGAIDNGTSNIRSATITAETAFVPDASGGADLGTTALEFNDLFLNDAGSIQFGDDQDVTLTHVADTGLLLNSTMAIQFNDASQYINAPSNAILDINATDEIELNATLVDINANVEISGTATTTGVHTFTAVPVFPNNTVETADIQDNAITLAKMAGGTDGNIISYDASGDPVAIATGSDGQVLTSTGAGSPPAFEDAASSIDGLSDAKSGGADFGNSLLIGHQTHGTLNAAYYNTGVGIGTLDALTSGDGNSGLGQNALTVCTTGQYNTAIGYSALLASITDVKNTAVGSGSLQAVDGGDSNIGIGWNAGDNITTGNSNIVIGASIDAASATADNQLNIGGWIIGEAGQITMPLQPAFLAIAADQTDISGDGTDYTVLFAASEALDRNADFSSPTFTAPVAGLYHFKYSAYLTGIGSGHDPIYSKIVASNRSSTNPAQHYRSGYGAELYISVSTLVDMDASDTATCFLDVRGGAKSVDVNAGSFFSGHLVC